MLRTVLRRLASTLPVGAFVTFACVATALAQGTAPAPGASFSFDRDPATVVVRFRETFGELSGAGPGPSLELTGDGRLAIRFPPYMKDAGRYRVALTPGQVQALIGSLVGHGLTGFDEASFRERRRALVAERRASARTSAEAELFEVSDRSKVEIELHLVREAPPAGASPWSRRIVWSGVRSDAKRFPEWREIQGLAAAHRELRALMNSPARVREP